MIETHTGHLTMLELGDRRIQEPPDGHVVAFGTESEIRHVAKALKLGNRELEARAKRRKAQRQARKRQR